MEQNAITYENLILSTYETEHILSLEIVKRINSHAETRIMAIIPEERAEEYIYTTTSYKPITVGYRTETGGIETLFRGVVTNIQINRQGDVYFMELSAKSNTYIMDVVKRYRSFQDMGMTVHQLISEVMGSYTNSDFMVRIPNEPIGRLIVQYRETDWDFLERIVTHYGAALIPDIRSDKLAYFVGVAECGEIYSANPYQYLVSKSMGEYLKVKENQWSEVTEIDFTVFQINDYRIFQIGDFINLDGKELTVESAIHTLKDGILTNIYNLKRKEGFKGLEMHNPEIVGASIIGQVSGVARDKVMVDLEIDGAGRAAYWFPYSTMSASPDGSGWYCMPEKGDQVRVYFPTNIEADAYAVSAVSGHQPSPGASKDPMGNPNVKYLQTQNDQVIKFAEDGIVINSGSGQATIFLKNSGELMLYGAQSINVTAQESLALLSKGDLVMGAQESITIKKTGSSITLDKEGNIKLEGNKIFSN